MKRPSFTFIISSLFVLYISHSIYGMVKLIYTPACDPGETCYDYYMREKPRLQLLCFASIKNRPASKDALLVLKVTEFTYDTPWTKELSLNLFKETKNNGTLFLHLFLLKQDKNVRTFRGAASESFHVYSIINLIRFQPPSSSFELLKGEKNTDKTLSIGHIKKEVGFSILMGIESLPEKNIPPELYNFIRLNEERKILPIMHYDYLSDRYDKLVPVPGLNNVTLALKYSPVNIGRFRLMIHAEITFGSLKQYGFTDKDLDMVKSIFSSTNLYILAITIFVSSFHLLFDFLAIKSDVSFWRSRTSLVGLSLKTLFWRAFSQTVIFLYLADEQTSLLILIPTGIGTVIEFWKIQRVMPIDWKRLKFKDVELTSEEKFTQTMDAKGMKYLSYILYPLTIGGAIYSLLYLQHKSWYSWVVHSLVNGVYGFGFLLMLPQLFINYKLKSVAHLPWKVFMYKAFNTFVDDIFAFIIDMPVGHRIACFRDDVVFLIYLYQRWLYPVDNNRVEGEHTKSD